MKKYKKLISHFHTCVILRIQKYLLFFLRNWQVPLYTSLTNKRMKMKTIHENNARANANIPQMSIAAVKLSKSHYRTLNCWSTGEEAESARWKPRRHWNGKSRVFDESRREERGGARERGRKGKNSGQRTNAAFQKSFYESHMWPPSPFIPRFIFLAPCVTSLLYPPATSTPSFPPSPPPLRSFPHGGKGYRGRSVDTHRTPSSLKADPRKFREKFLLHIHRGVIVRR